MKPALRVIDGDKPAPKVLDLWVCGVCDGTTMVKARRMALVDQGKIKGGSQHWVCATCLARGIVTVCQ